jgi:hypothetical protein
MSFTYNMPPTAQTDYVRLLISDTKGPGIFSDEELNTFIFIQQATWQTAQFYSYPLGRTLPATPTSLLRVAALALDSLAANGARLAAVIKLADVTLNPAAAVKALQDQAARYRCVDDESGAFAIIEQTPTQWAFADRFWKVVQRQSGTGI